MNKTVIIFSGFNMRAVIAFIRTLEKYSVQYAIIAKSEDDVIFETVYASKVISTRQQTRLDLNDMLNSLQKVQKQLNSKEYFIVPSTEALNRFILDNLTEFEKHKCIFPVVNKKLYEQVSDKYSFGKICEEYNIIIPKEYSSVEKSKLPFVAKPKKYIGKSGKIYAPQIIKEENDLEKFILKYDQDDFYFQEYVEGRCIYILYYFDKNKNVYKFSQENLLQQENGKSILVAKSSELHKNTISLQFEKLFIDIGFRGLVMIELKLLDNQFVMIEANPRFWGPSQLFVDANMNFFNCLLKDYSVLDKNDFDSLKINTDTMYFWDDGISENIDERKEVSFYNYTMYDFEQDRVKLNRIELFNREDTMNLYKRNI